MLAGTVAAAAAQPDRELAAGDRGAEVDGERERVALALGMLEHRTQRGRGGNAAERADEGPVGVAGASAPLAAVADARVFHRSFGDQTAELYGRGGQLLATAVQVAYFRA